MKVLDRAQETLALRVPTSISATQILLVTLLVGVIFTRFWRLSTPDEFYFDEAFFPTTAQEILRGDPAAWLFIGHENTHPPLSKLFMAGGMAVFGEDSRFGYRLFGALAGVGSVVFMYLLAKRLFKSEVAGLAAGFLLTVDGLNFAQSRIATPDTYVLFFVLGSIYFLLTERFLLSGLFFGASIACKWVALFTLFPIVFYFLYLFWRRKEVKQAPYLFMAPLSLLAFYLGTPVIFAEVLSSADAVKAHLPAPLFSSALGFWMALFALLPLALVWIYLRRRRRWTRGDQFLREASIAIPLFFVVVPLSVYLASYLPMLLNGQSLGHLRDLQTQMYQFHTNLEATHPYQSPWITWPIMMRPVFLYLGPDNAKIYSLGNPWIFWFGLGALAFLAWEVRKALRFNLHTENGQLDVRARLTEAQFLLLFVLVTYLGFWLTWARQPRIMFIYHYLPALAFVILASSYVIGRLWQQPWGRSAAIAYLGLVAATFVFFYPHLAAVSVSTDLDEWYYPFDWCNPTVWCWR